MIEDLLDRSLSGDLLVEEAGDRQTLIAKRPPRAETRVPFFDIHIRH